MNYSFWTLSSYWSFMIDAHARTIYDDMVGWTFEHSVDRLEFGYPLDVMFYFQY